MIDIERNRCYFGDSLEVLKTFPDKIVQTCITSPPYWGLRDYGTAKWEGGSPDCDHVVGQIRTGVGLEKLGERFSGGGHKAAAPLSLTAKAICPKCGALRIDAQLGLEPTPEEFVDRLVEIFREVRRVLKDDGTLWLNLGDSYCGNGPGSRDSERWPKQSRNDHKPDRGIRRGTNRNNIADLKPKDLVGIPWMVAFALRADGWYLRSDIIWAKPNPMPESVTDRPTKSHEYLFLLSKSERYYYDADSIKEKAETPLDSKARQSFGGPKLSTSEKSHAAEHGKAYRNERKGTRNRRSVWNVATTPYSGAHFATFPPKLIQPCVLAGSRAGDLVLDNFIGSGTTAEVCQDLGRDWIGIDLNQANAKLQRDRTSRIGMRFV